MTQPRLHLNASLPLLITFLLLSAIAIAMAAVPPNSIVHVIAPSGKSSEADLPRIRSYITANGLVPSLRSDVYSPIEPIYANTDEFRASDLIDALTDNSSVVWCIRGGAGATRLIPYLEARLPAQLPPKLLIGFSDITVLHTYLIKKYGWSTVHGGLLSQLINGGIDSDSEAWLWDIVYNRKQELQYSIQCLNNYCKNESPPTVNLTSSVVGGNLVLVEGSIGTAWEIETAGKLVLLEDTGEAPYRTERSLGHLAQAGLFTNASGVLLGDFIGSGDEILNNFVLQRFADSLTHIPVYKLPGVGHARRNLPLPLNTRARIEYVGGLNRLLTVDVPQWQIESANRI